MIVGVDASRNRSGGARAHLIAVMERLRPQDHDVEHVHLWAPRDLLDDVADQPWLSKHCPTQLGCSLPSQLAWQFSTLARELRRLRCELLFTTDASTLSRYTPMVAFSQDLLAYERDATASLGWSRERIRLLAIRRLQNAAFRRSVGVIFLTEYAAKVVQSSCGPIDRYTVIPHGVAETFRAVARQQWPTPNERPVRLLYVSNAAMYKHQWVVIRAVANLIERGYPLELTLIGGGSGRAQALIDQTLRALGAAGDFVTQLPFTPHGQLPDLMANADVFVFASACEALGITLLEAMAAGLPIACSRRSSLPETLRDGGVYFDPEDEASVAAAVEQLILDADLRNTVSTRASEYAKEYTWNRCAQATWDFVLRKRGGG